jgi:hypothetical protein
VECSLSAAALRLSLPWRAATGEPFLQLPLEKSVTLIPYIGIRRSKIRVCCRKYRQCQRRRSACELKTTIQRCRGLKAVILQISK